MIVYEVEENVGARTKWDNITQGRFAVLIDGSVYALRLFVTELSKVVEVWRLYEPRNKCVVISVHI